nr:MAG TPA: hypothetical protein [Caudoviricetes sp.]
MNLWFWQRCWACLWNGLQSRKRIEKNTCVSIKNVL